MNLKCRLFGKKNSLHICNFLGICYNVTIAALNSAGEGQKSYKTVYTTETGILENWANKCSIYVTFIILCLFASNLLDV